MSPPAPHHPPPAPDWILGDDGHWKPPPFGGGPGRPRPSPGAPPPGPGPHGGRDGRRSVSGWLGMRRRDVVWGVVGLVIAGVGLATQGAELVGMVRGDDETSEAAASGYGSRVEASMEDRDLVVLGPDGDAVCPSVEDVSDLMAHALPLPPEIVREGVEWTVDDVELSGIECRYGDAVRLGKLDGFGDRVHPLRKEGGGSAQPGPFPGSARIDDPATGTATFVFEDRTETSEAFVTLPLEHVDYVESLAFAALN